HDLASLENGTLENRVLGAAHTGTLCKYYRVAETEDMPHTYSMVTVLAHEWGHLLGMVHDGVKATYYTPAYEHVVCNPKDGYIMAPHLYGARNGQWSACSLAHLKGFVRTLDQACLDITSQTRYTINMRELPGAKITKKQLCHDSFPDFGPMTYKTAKLSECSTMCCSKRFDTCMDVALVDGMKCKDGH
ncbi:hypothetical protein HPB47_013764, partial [Ixodes persulcatus]